MHDAVIVAARRTPIGKLNGAMSSLSAAQMGAAVIKAVFEDAGMDPAMIDEVIMGQVLTRWRRAEPGAAVGHWCGAPG